MTYSSGRNLTENNEFSGSMLNDFLSKNPGSISQQTETENYIGKNYSDLYAILRGIYWSILDIKNQLKQKLSDETDRIQKIHTIPINSFGVRDYELKKIILISIEERNNDEFVACFYDADIYGYGESLIEAIDDLKKNILYQYDFLRREIEKGYKLGPIPEKQLAILSEFIVRG